MVTMRDLIDARRNFDLALEGYDRAVRFDRTGLSPEENVKADIEARNACRLAAEFQRTYQIAFEEFMKEGIADGARQAS